MIKKELCPDVICNGREIINNGENIPVKSIYNEIKSLSSLKLLILGDASMGKSTFARTLEALYLAENIPVVFWECKNINQSNLSSLIDPNTTKDTVYIFDGYEEYVGDKDDLKNEIRKLVDNKINVILSSR